MKTREPNLVYSGLNRTLTRDGITVEINIIRLEDSPEWTLEVVNAAGTSTVWDDPLPSDDEAYAEFERTVNEEGMEAFLDKGKVIPFPGKRWRGNTTIFAPNGIMRYRAYLLSGWHSIISFIR